MTMFLNVLNLLIKITWRQKTNNNTDENKQNENNNNNKNLKKKKREREKENVVDSYKEFWYIYVGTKAQICILDLKPYLIMWIYPRRSKRLDRSLNGGSHTEKMEEYSPRRLSFLNGVNAGQASTWAT